MLFKVDVRNLVKNRLYITKETHIQPSVYESWPYYEYEYLLEDLKEYIENENKKNAEENSKYDMSSIKSQMSAIKSGKFPINTGGFKAPPMPKAPKF